MGIDVLISTISFVSFGLGQDTKEVMAVPGYRADVNAYRAGYPDASSGWRMDPVELDADESVVGEVEACPVAVGERRPKEIRVRRLVGRPPAPVRSRRRG